MDRGSTGRCAAVQRAAPRRAEFPNRAGRRAAAGDDAVDGGREARESQGRPGPQTVRSGAGAGVTTLFDRVWDAHVVKQLADGVALLYVDLHLVHEVTSPQAFAGLRREGRRVRRPERTLATVDHNVPTGERSLPIADPVAAVQVDTLGTNAQDFGVELFGLTSPGQGIVHVIGPELGATQPGMVIVCGDSHTSTHGAFGAFALGIGTSEVEHVLATQCIVLNKPRNLEARITGISAPGEVTFDYLEGRPRAPSGAAWAKAVERWQTFRSDPTAPYDAQVRLDASRVGPQVTWGTTPGMVADITARVPDPA